MRQRSKAELLKILEHKNIVDRDQQRDDRSRMSGNAQYWKSSVHWAYHLWMYENFNSTSLKNMLAHANKFGELTADRKNEIREKMKDCKWQFLEKERVISKNPIYQTEFDLTYWNHKISCDYSLLVCEYLIDKKKFAPDQIDKMCKIMKKTENCTIATTYEMRDALFNHKNIWIELNAQDTEEYLEQDYKDLEYEKI